MTEKSIFDQTLAELGDNTPESVAARFATLHREFDERHPAQLMTGPNGTAWSCLGLGRKSGALRKITDNWLKAAPPH